MSIKKEIQEGRLKAGEKLFSKRKLAKLNDILVTNKPILSFNDEFDEIPVMTETRTLICIGNISKNNLKVQFSVVVDRK